MHLRTCESRVLRVDKLIHHPPCMGYRSRHINAFGQNAAVCARGSVCACTIYRVIGNQHVFIGRICRGGRPDFFFFCSREPTGQPTIMSMDGRMDIAKTFFFFNNNIQVVGEMAVIDRRMAV